MNKNEFEKLALRNNETIGVTMYATIERYYIGTNQYHRNNGGIDETKQEFINRVFGGKINTSKTIASKIANESIKENRYLLQGHDENRLNEMDILIKEHFGRMLQYNF